MVNAKHETQKFPKQFALWQDVDLILVLLKLIKHPERKIENVVHLSG